MTSTMSRRWPTICSKKIPYTTICDAMRAIAREYKNNKSRLKFFQCATCKKYHLTTLKDKPLDDHGLHSCQ